MNKLKTLTTFLPSLAYLHDEAAYLASKESEYNEYKRDALPSFDIFRTYDGAGQEGGIAFLKEKTRTIGALLFAYDHESSLASDLDDPTPETVFDKAPKVAQPLLTAGSPFLWNYEDSPVTKERVFATVAVWNFDGYWSYSTSLGEEALDEGMRHIKYSFKEFEFVKNYKNSLK
jgi:hypothetical protein